MDNIKKLNNAAGVLSGDLFVCGLIIKKQELLKLSDVNDSKKLTEKKRAELFPKIVELAVDYELIRMTPQEVDTLNVFQARMEGFRRAIEVLSKRTTAGYAVIDGSFVSCLMTCFFINYLLKY